VVNSHMSLRVAIVGCGKIADAHAAQIRRIRGCDIVAVCDREELMARQLAERFGVRRHFDDLSRLLEESKPDVVHVTTPPQSHFEIARRCLERGCHVYVEKPFALDTREAEELVRVAARRALGLTVGHDAQFSHAARRMREVVQSGYLGERVVHMESYYGYDLTEPTYARAVLEEKNHWVRGLPGGLLQNIISHGIARIAEFLRGVDPRVLACGFASAAGRSCGDGDVVDELRVVILDEDQTAYFTFSSGMRPLLHQFRIFGTRNGLVLDERQQTVVKLRGASFKSYAERFVPPVVLARQYLSNVARNVRHFVANDFHMEAGKKELITGFYRSIVHGTPAPIPSREILLATRLMDLIFERLGEVRVTIRSREGVPC
jgi:predicted dehydrogenase